MKRPRNGLPVHRSKGQRNLFPGRRVALKRVLRCRQTCAVNSENERTLVRLEHLQRGFRMTGGDVVGVLRYGLLLEYSKREYGASE